MPMSPRLLRPRQAGGFDPRTISGLGFWYDASDTKTLFTTSLGSVSAVSSPTDIPNCAGWWDASDASTLFDATSGGSQVSNGGAVARWNDKSGLGRHATQATSANRPTYSASAAGGKGAVSWGASTNSRSLAWASGSNNTVLREVFVVCSYDRGTTFGGFEGLIGGTANDSANIGLIGNGSGTTAFYTASNLSIWDNLIINGANSGAYSNIVPSGGINGWPALPALNSLSVMHAFGAADQASNGICIGNDRSTADRGWIGNICEVVAYSAPLTDTQRVQVQKYLAAKWPTAFVDNYTAATSPSDPVGAWLDKSGNGRTLTQATAALRPVVGTVSQRSAVDWGTGTNVKHLANSTSGNWREVAVVLDYDGPNPFGTIYAVVGGNANQPGFLTLGTTAWLTVAQGGGYTNFNTNGTETATALPAILSPSVVQAWRVLDTPAIDGIRVGTDRAIAGRGWQGKICEIMAWTRRLTTAERNAVSFGLGRKWGISVVASTIPYVSNADAQDWIDRVYANGGTVSTSTAAAVNTFCNDIDAAGIRDKFYRVNLFCGDQLAAALVPLYRSASFGGTAYGATTDVNTGVGPFVAGDYTLATGLTGNGSSKHLRTDVRLDQLPAGVETDIHLANYIRTAPNSNATISSYFFHSTDAANRHRYEITPNNGTLGRETGQAGPSSPTYPAMTLVSRSSTTSLFTYRNDVAGSELTNSIVGTATGIPLTVFARNLVTGTPPTAGSYGPTLYFSGALGGYSIGRHLTASQVAAYSSAMAAFQTALGRNV